MYVFVARRETLLDIFVILLTAKNGYNSKGHGDLETKIARMQSGLDCIKETSSKNGIVRVEHVDNIKSDVFCVMTWVE
jgi:hypothetical protein